MPSNTVSPAVAIRATFSELIAEAADLSGRLEVLVGVKTRQPGAFHGKVDHSQPPWNAPVAYAITDLHSLARFLEKDIRRKQGLPQRVRGDSDENTQNALKAVRRLAEGADDGLVGEYIREMSRWLRNARLAALGAGDDGPDLDRVEAPKRLPRTPGKPEPACPWCHNHTLRVKILENEIWCISPACPPEIDGVKQRKQKARMDYSKIVGDWVIRWDDGVILGVAA